MKKTTRILSVILSVLLLVTPLTFCFAEDDKPMILMLGDSIAQAYGVDNCDEAGYGKILADTNGWNYANHALAARTSEGLIKNISLSYVQNDIKKATYIFISIGGNDFLCDDKVVGIALSALTGIESAHVRELQEQYYENLCQIIATIKELNPDATIIVQHIFSSWNGLLGIAYKRIVNRINDSIDRFNTEHPGQVLVAKPETVMEGNTKIIAEDTIHPNAEGNVVMAKFMQEFLYDNDIVDSKEVTVLAEGINWDYYAWRFGDFGGAIIKFLVQAFTGNLF